MFKTYLKDDSIKTESKDGVVTLTGTVAEASHKSLAQDTVASLPGVKSVDNQLHSQRRTTRRTFGHLDRHEGENARFCSIATSAPPEPTVNVKDGVVTLNR